jgi:hypothetical protein
VDPEPTSPGELDEKIIELAGRVFAMAREGDAEGLAAYVDAGVPVNLTNDKGDSLLMLAAYHEHPAAVRVLLERGADPQRVNDRGQTPLAGAVFKKSAEIVQLLVAAGADPDLGSPSARATAQFFQLPDFEALLG